MFSISDLSVVNIHNQDNTEIDESGQTKPKGDVKTVDGKDGDPSNITLNNGNEVILDDNASKDSAGVTGRGSVSDSIQSSTVLTASLRNAMQGNLATDNGRDALLTAITTPIAIPYGYSWDTTTGQLSYIDMSLADEEGEDKGGWKIKTPDGKEPVVEQLTDDQSAALSNALRLRDMATSAYTEASGQDLSRKGDIAMAEQIAISRKGQNKLGVVRTNVQNFMGTMQTALNRAKSGDWNGVDEMLMQELPAVPPGLAWDAQKGNFIQPTGFQGRMLTPDVQEWKQVVAPAYKFYDRVTKITDAGRRMDMERQNAIQQEMDSADLFREHMKTDVIDSAEEELVKSRQAATKKLQIDSALDWMKLAMEAASNPTLLYNMQKTRGSRVEER